MPRIKVNDDIYLNYEIHGAGEPLLLIEGLGYASWMWYRQIPQLSRKFQVIVFDNRGVGDSDKPDVPYSVEMMADDAAGLLLELGIDRAHVLGASMGGYIAQAFACRHPQKLGALILVCTAFGGPRSVPTPADTVNAMVNVEGLTAEQAIIQGMSAALTKEYLQANEDEIKRIVGWRLEKPTPRNTWNRQFMAVAQANLEQSAAGIQAPTLILTGEEDRVIPAENSRMLHQTIPGSVFKAMPGVGHLFFIERAEEFNLEVESFLKAHPLSKI